jgi:hypothetical protein
MVPCAIRGQSNSIPSSSSPIGSNQLFTASTKEWVTKSADLYRHRLPKRYQRERTGRRHLVGAWRDPPARQLREHLDGPGPFLVAAAIDGTRPSARIASQIRRLASDTDSFSGLRRITFLTRNNLALLRIATSSAPIVALRHHRPADATNVASSRGNVQTAPTEIGLEINGLPTHSATELKPHTLEYSYM